MFKSILKSLILVLAPKNSMKSLLDLDKLLGRSKDWPVHAFWLNKAQLIKMSELNDPCKWILKKEPLFKINLYFPLSLLISNEKIGNQILWYNFGHTERPL